jgi:hypothetical protein
LTASLPLSLERLTVFSTRKSVRTCAAFISSLAVGLAIGSAWLFLGNGDASELMVASAIVAVGVPFQFMRDRAGPRVGNSGQSYDCSDAASSSAVIEKLR